MTYQPKLYSSLGAGVVLLHQDHVLLVQMNYSEHRGKWILPGGAVEPREHPEQAAAREAWEEAGVAVNILSQIAVRHRVRDDGSADVYWIYRAELKEADLESTLPKLAWPADEIMEARFWPVAQAISSPDVRPMTRLYVQMALEAPLAEHTRWPNPPGHELDDSCFGVPKQLE